MTDFFSLLFSCLNYLLLMGMPYLFDEQYKVWIKKDYKSSIPYCDGDEVEQRIRRSVQNSKDVSCMSEELEATITDWASLCFLSKKRANLLRPFQSLFNGKRILEIGCGAGPICRFLGESGATVYGLEPSLQRASIAAERCRDLSNVRIFCDDIAHFDTDEPFDGIVMVGVLEYATKYSNSKHAALDFLNNLKRFLKPGSGFIITAIENQLGLKYFSGFAEDHAGAFMHSINDNYRPGEATTYGRKTLLDIFQQAGFAHNEVYLPYPDYKLPSLVFHPGFYEKLEGTGFNLDSILSNISYTDPQQKIPLFSLDKALPLIAKNGLLEELSNSFCVLSRFNAVETAEPQTVFSLYNTARKREYCKQTSFVKDGNALKVVRSYMDDQTERLAAPVISFPAEETAYPGTVYYYNLVEIVNQPRWKAAQVSDWLKGWFGFIKKDLIENELYKETDFANPFLKINARYIDAVPINTMLHEGKHCFIDLEVDLREDIETGYLLFRAIYSSISRLSNLAMPEEMQYTEIDVLLQYLFSQLGYALDEKQLDAYYEKEAQLVNAVAPYSLKTVKGSITRLGTRPELQTLISAPTELLRLQIQNEELRKKLMAQEEIAQNLEGLISAQQNLEGLQRSKAAQQTF